MKFLSTLAVLVLLISLPVLAAETAAEVEAANTVVEEVPVTSMHQTEGTEEIDLGALVGAESRLRFCFPGEPDYCASDADCPSWCYCHPIGNCCE